MRDRGPNFDHSIVVENIVRRFDTRKISVTALDNIHLRVNRGELFGLLGSNGAGKTTLIKILVTLLLPSSGTASVAGFDVVRNAKRVRRHISMVSGGEYSGYGVLSLKQQLWVFSQFSGIPSQIARKRIADLLEVTGMGEVQERKVGTLSTGMRQKMQIIRGFLADPEVLFLDEPTIGLDVPSARNIRSYIKDWLRENPSKTILLTTHDLHEAESLCDRASILHAGKILATDTPTNLRNMGTLKSSFSIVLANASERDISAVLRSLDDIKIDQTEHQTTLYVPADERKLARVIELLTSMSLTILSITKQEPTFEDVFVDLLTNS